MCKMVWKEYIYNMSPHNAFQKCIGFLSRQILKSTPNGAISYQYFSSMLLNINLNLFMS